MEIVRWTLYGLLRGFRDSLAGFTLIFTYDRKQPAHTHYRHNVGSSSGTPPQKETSLAQRRAAQQAERRQRHSEQKEESENNVLYRIMQCSILNGIVFGLSLLFFDYVLLPGLSVLLEHFLGAGEEERSVWVHVRPILSTLFNMFWVLPIFALSRIINTIWFQDIADSAYRQRQGQPQLISSLSKMIADVFISIFIQLLFLMQASVIRMFPVVGVSVFVSCVHMCMLHSLYAFEYRWFNMGWELYKRLSYIELNWPYFIGFGFPLAAITMYPSSVYLSGCVFSLLFPVFIISANEAEPVPYNGYPLQLFSLVVSVSNYLIHTAFSRHNIPNPSVTPSKTRPPPPPPHRY